jgi:tetratricopeptide (TPR) repeat protein
VSSCTNRLLGDKLYAYELGMLGDQERQEVEIHILECAFCGKTARQFEPTALLLRHDPDVRLHVQDLTAEDTGDRVESSESPRRRKWVSFVPFTAAAAILLAFLILKPWQIEFRSSQEVTAADNRLAIMYFENIVDPSDAQRLGEIATNLLITDLSQSSYLEVMSSQRLYDILKLLGREGQKTADRNVASDIAGKADAQWLLVGSILQVEPALVLTSQLVDVKTGKVRAAQRINGAPGESIFSLVDKLTAEIKKDLPLPAGARSEPERPVAQVTTSSPEAYRYYLAGVDYANKIFIPEATASFQKALQYDSTFAMAYYQLASIADRKLIDKAVQYLQRAGRRDGYFIRSRKAALTGNAATAIAELQEAVKYFPDEKEAFYLLGNYKYSLREYPVAIDYLVKATEIDPLYKAAYNRLSYVYDAAGDLEKALAAINQYISLAPDEPNPLDSRGDLYSSHGMIDEAIESYRQALAIKPDFHYSRQKLGELYLFKRQFLQADSCFRELASAADQETRASGRMNLALVQMLQCKLPRAIQVLDQGIAADSLELTDSRNREVANKLYLKSRIALAVGDTALSLKELKETIRLYSLDNPNDKLACRNLYSQLLAASGNYAAAKTVIDELKSQSERAGRGRATYRCALGSLALAEGDLDSAQSCYEAAVTETHDFYALYMYARTLLQYGKTTEAVSEFEKLLHGNDYWFTCYDLDYQDAGYFLGRAYEETGASAKAAERYQKYLDFWQKANPNLPLVLDAANRLARLKARTTGI